MLEQNSFDNDLVDEHIEYYAVAQIDRLARRHGSRIVDLTLNSINGGSFQDRWISHEGAPYTTNLPAFEGLHRAVSGLRTTSSGGCPPPTACCSSTSCAAPLPDGTAVELHAAMYLRVRDGHIPRIEEYLDSGKRA